MKKIHPVAAGLLQALGVVVYCILFALLTRVMPKDGSQPEYLIMPLVLTLFVFSAGLTGSLVFGYPAYLAWKGEMKQALTVVGFTLLFLLLAIAAAVPLILFN